MDRLLELAEHFKTDELGICRPDWPGIHTLIQSKVPEEQWKSVWEEVSKRWVEGIGKAFGPGYHVYESANFLILADAPEKTARAWCQKFESALKQILKNLEGLAQDEGYGKHVVLMFSDLDEYFRYVSHYYPEGEHPASGGICLQGDGYVHFALPVTDDNSTLTMLVHELTHGCLSHLPLPLWLNEALAMRMEEAVCGVGLFIMSEELAERHFTYWNPETMQQFWSGESWSMVGDSFELSYSLAGVIWRKLEVDLRSSSKQLIQFASQAHFDDAGENACMTIFKCSLGEVVQDFLGPGEWKPLPEQWQTNRTLIPPGAK